jgi:hypothetical protein
MIVNELRRNEAISVFSVNMPLVPNIRMINVVAGR